jgi:4-hydroxybenzoate polyprenyltransferase
MSVRRKLRSHQKPDLSKWSLRALAGNPSLPVVVIGTVLAMVFFAAAILATSQMVSGPYPNLLGAAIFVCAAVFLVCVTRFIERSRRRKRNR